MHTPVDSGFGKGFRHPAEPSLDTLEEQAQALLVDLRESFAPTYLTLMSIIEGVLLGLLFQLLSMGSVAFSLRDPGFILVLNNVVLIALVWNEYRMGSSMFRWVPSLLDAVIPFTLGGLQAAMILTASHRMAWLGWLATFYLSAVVAYENMYRRSAEEQRNAFVLARNRTFRHLNIIACIATSLTLWGLYAVHRVAGSQPGWPTLIAVTVLNVAFLIRGEINWRMIVAAARRTRDDAARRRAPATTGAK